MRVKLSLFLLAFAFYAVHADIEACTRVSDCSRSIKRNCDEISKAVKESGRYKRHYAVLTCKNRICMCNIQFSDDTVWEENKPTKIAEYGSHEQGEDLYVLDDYGNPVKLDLNTSAAWITDVDDTDVKFYLSTHPTTVENEIFVNDIKSLEKSGFDPNKATIIVTHGWMNSKASPACTLITDAILKHGPANVIVVDWSKISKSIYYPTAAHSVPQVGIRVANMINFLQKNKLKLSSTTLVGHSLGAHVVGLAGYHAEGRVRYIFGLDPALPHFSNTEPGQRISSQDADFVQIIHTNGGRLGYLKNIGHADYYPNGGTFQPNCGLDMGWSCSHARAYLYFSESIVSDVGFYGKQCPGSDVSDYIDPDTCNGRLGLMGGLSIDPTQTGIYCVRTNYLKPYAQETCSEVTDCSDATKSKCDEMSKTAEESDDNQKHYAVLACKNGICMCNVQFPGITDTPPSEETQKRAEQPTTENPAPSP